MLFSRLLSTRTQTIRLLKSSLHVLCGLNVKSEEVNFSFQYGNFWLHLVSQFLPIILVLTCSAKAMIKKTPTVLMVLFCHCPRCSRWRTASASCETFPITSTKKSPVPSDFRSPISSGQWGTRRRSLNPTVWEGNAPKVGAAQHKTRYLEHSNVF